MVLAWNVVRENLRNRVLYLLAGVSLLLLFVMLTGPGGKVTDADGNNVLATAEGVMRVGFALVGVFGSLVTVVLSMSTVTREFERGTMALLLVRPVERWQIAGSFLLGNILTAWLFLLAMVLPLFRALMVRDAYALVPALWQAVPALALNITIIAAVTTLISTRAPGPAAAFVTLLLYGFGAVGPELSALAAISREAWAPLLRLLMTAVPPVGAVNAEVLKLFTPGLVVDWRVLLGALLYLWAAAGLTVAGLYRREV